MTNNGYKDFTLGELLNDIRKEKKISTKTIFSSGITRPTYYRFVRGEGEISLVNFFKITEILGIELTEFEELIPLIKQGHKSLENKLAVAVSKKNSYDVKAIKEESLEMFNKTDGLGYLYIHWQATLNYASLLNDTAQFEQVVQQIKTHLESIDLWTNIELRLFSSIEETLRFEEYDHFFKNFLLSHKRFEDEFDPWILDSLFFSYYETALDSRDILHVESATNFILNRNPNRFNYRFRLWRLFLVAVTHVLAGSHEYGQKKYDKLKKMIIYIFKDEHKIVLEINRLNTLWDKVWRIVLMPVE
ncbi:helix-turn-helix domain-containing protein [Candidatus Enterococcus mangumiae]|uniref:HTH cro/C1-type domain-containing protein n=1 Tax=Candidatus Enterococcus mangumiae TaxID=2230878 RepID=A0ABZ2SXV6_9ENTE|nr:helix-turn-helix transcriptional regulator [Enterococcus sp. DIV1094]MBO0489704.1 helix-turn-helix transcriptional regulator [Enterococcus sp. DIV1094]